MRNRRYGTNGYPKYPMYNGEMINLKDYGPNPYVVNIKRAAMLNNNFRLALWTGEHLQTTLMDIKTGEDIGLEIHPDVDQFLFIVRGRGTSKMGKDKENLNYERTVYENDAIFVPAGTWHNVVNTGNTSLKLFSTYAPPNHPRGTVHKTKEDAEKAEKY